MNKYKYITDYKDNEVLRKSFNELTQNTYGFDFEDWYQNGYWQDRYIPCSLVDVEKVIANVSVNLMDFELNGQMKHYIQLGTVMTDKEYRSQGLSRFIIENILKEWIGKTDGIYLFANDSVLEFYPKFGFQAINEYQYSKQIVIDENKQINVEKVDMNIQENQQKLNYYASNCVSNSKFCMRNNPELVAFYTTSFMKDSIYFIKEYEAFVIADINGDTLFIHEILSLNVIDLENIIIAFGGKIKTVILGFTPKDSEGYIKSLLKEEDTTLFVLGQSIENLQSEEIMFPTLSHA